MESFGAAVKMLLPETGLGILSRICREIGFNCAAGMRLPGYG